MSLRIAVDIDDVLNDFLSHTIRKINYLYDKNYSPSDIEGWNMLDYINITEEQLYSVWTKEFMKNMPFKDGAKKLIDDLKKRGHSVILATACWSPYHQDREEMCLRELGVKSDDIIFIKKKYLLDVDVLIDDKIDNHLNEFGLPCKFENVLFNAPHNQDGIKFGWYYRVSDFEQILKVIDIIEAKQIKK